MLEWIAAIVLVLGVVALFGLVGEALGLGAPRYPGDEPEPGYSVCSGTS